MGDRHNPYNSSYALYKSVDPFAHPQAPAATLGAQPAAALSSQGVGLSPCFSFGSPGAAIPDIWLDPAVGAGEGAGQGAGVLSTTDGSPACSSYNMATTADWGSALSVSSSNDVEAADESLL